MDINNKKIKSVKYFYNSTIGDFCYLKALISALQLLEEDKYPLNFILKIIKKNEKIIVNNIYKCYDLLS